jgi:hypothetical protein
MKRYNWLEECLTFSATNRPPTRFITNLKWYKDNAEEIRQALNRLAAQLAVPWDWERRISRLPMLPKSRMQIFNEYLPEIPEKRGRLFLELQLCEVAAAMMAEYKLQSVRTLEHLSDYDLAQRVLATSFNQEKILFELSKILIRNYLYFLTADEETFKSAPADLNNSQFLRLESIPAMTVVNPNLIRRFCEKVQF